MRRAQCYFFVSTPLRMRWLVAGSVGPGVRRHGPVAAFYRARHCDGLISGQLISCCNVAVCGKLRTYAYLGTALAAALLGWDAGTVVRPVDRALHT